MTRWQAWAGQAASFYLPVYYRKIVIPFPLQSLWIFYGDMLLGMLPPLSTAATPATLLAALPYGLELGRLLSYGIQPGDARRWAVSYWRTVLHDNMALEPSVQVGGGAGGPREEGPV